MNSATRPANIALWTFAAGPTLFALAILWIVLKVPGTLHSASHVETHARTAMRHVNRSMHRALAPAHHVVRHRTAL